MLMAFAVFGYAQNPRMERLVLQYRAMQSVSEKEKSALLLDVTNKFIDEGNYQSAVTVNEKIKEGADNKDLKKLLSGKAEFLNDNYEVSLAFLNAVNEKNLDKRNYYELGFYKLLNFNHLLQRDSAYKQLTQMLLSAQMDTVGVFSEMSSFKEPVFLNLKKARRRSALFPGAGLYYVHERKRAFTSALICFAAIGYAAISAGTGYYLTAVLTGGGEFLRFYKGGKRASVKIASQKNRAQYINHVLLINEYSEKKLVDLLK